MNFLVVNVSKNLLKIKTCHAILKHAGWLLGKGWCPVTITADDFTSQGAGVGGGTPKHYLYGYVPPNGVGILKLLI